MNNSTSLLSIKSLLAVAILLLSNGYSHAQAVTGIATDYKGFWKSSSSAKNPVRPDDSHNLLSFTYNGINYSTGVNDAKLKANSVEFVAGEYHALPLQNLNGTANSNTKVGKGAKADGVGNGAGTPPGRALGQYLNDGINGLDLGTAVANLPAGSMFMSASNLKAEKIGDGVPDILVTQVADPGGSPDSYEFTDINGARIGNAMHISLSNISPVGDWVADFYEATGSTVLQAGFTETSRAIRLWAADFSAFGIDSSNISQIAYFKVNLSGDSDIAFVAYNTTAITIQAVLSMSTPSTTVERVQHNNSLSTSLYPNPSRGSITIAHEKMKRNASIGIYNNAGVLVRTQNCAAGQTATSLNLSNLGRGSYYAVLMSETKRTTMPFLMQ